jgi:PAS domain S-box-containing protein
VKDEPYLFTNARGEEHAILSSVSPLWESGRVVGAVALWQDITEQKRVERALRESQEQLSRFIEHAPAAMAMLDTEMRYLSYSRRWLTDYRLQDQELRGRSHYEVFPEIPDRWKEIHRRCLAGAVERAEEDPFVRADGSVQWLRWEVRPWYLVSGAVGGLVMLTDDVTERKREQEQYLEAERARARLAQTLAAEIAHRTKNNLAIVAGLLQTQLDHQADRPLDPGLVRDAIARIHTFVVLQEQMYRTQVEEVELVAALRRIGELNRQALAPSGTTVSVEGEAIRYPSRTGTDLCVVANELVTNALKYGAPDPDIAQVEITVWQEGGRLHVSVWNSGAPLAPDFQLSKEAKTGLDLVHAVVEDTYGGTFLLRPERGGTHAEIVLDDARLREGG